MLDKFFKTKSPSAQIARNRLKLVIARERLGLTHDQIMQLRQELGAVIAKYFKIDDHNSLEIEIDTDAGQPELNVKTPVGATVR